MIPKIIHYCWFGSGKKKDLAIKCIESWKRVCPDYQIIEWNESNFDIHQHPYLEYCHRNKKYAFLSDFARLIILEKYGGIYLDIDVELVKPYGNLLKQNAFYGFENNEFINTGLGFGVVPHHYSVQEMIREYEKIVPGDNGGFKLQTCPFINTRVLEKIGLVRNGKAQQIEDIAVLPREALNPYDDATGKLNLTDETISINWYGKSWMPWYTVLRSRMTRPFHSLFGEDCFRWLKRN